MASDEQCVEYSTTCSASIAADYLRSLADRIIQGSALLQTVEQSVVLNFGSTLTFDLEAKVKPGKGKESLHLDISWKRPANTLSLESSKSAEFAVLEPENKSSIMSHKDENSAPRDSACPFLTYNGEHIKVASCPFLKPICTEASHE